MLLCSPDSCRYACIERRHGRRRSSVPLPSRNHESNKNLHLHCHLELDAASGSSGTNLVAPPAVVGSKGHWHRATVIEGRRRAPVSEARHRHGRTPLSPSADVATMEGPQYFRLRTPPAGSKRCRCRTAVGAAATICASPASWEAAFLPHL